MYAVRAAPSTSAGRRTDKPVDLTPGDGQVETTGLSHDGKTLYYATNADDIERRHIWKVPTSRRHAGADLDGDEIEMYPAPLASGKQLAVLTSAATQPAVRRASCRPTAERRRMIFPDARRRSFPPTRT